MEHWGDLPALPDTESGIAAIEREHMTKPRAMEVEGPRLHQPSSRHYPPSVEPLPAHQFATDPLTHHTIQLIQHARRLKQLIYMVQQQYESVKNGEGAEMLNFPPAPPVPPYQGPSPKHHIGKPFPFVAKDLDRGFARGQGNPPPKVDDLTCRRLLRKSVAALCAHAGYDSCAESILETLTDICHEYYLEMTKALRHAVDREAFTGRTGFQDAMEQVFHEMGIGPVRSLHEFYQNRVINYRLHMLQQCHSLLAEYERVKNPENRNIEEIKNIKVKEEPVSDIQFPTAHDDEDAETEQMLDLQGLSSLDIPVDQESSSDLGQEDVLQIKTEPPEKSTLLDSFDESPDGEGHGSPLPHLVPDELMHSCSIPVADLTSPPQIKKKRKR